MPSKKQKPEGEKEQTALIEPIAAPVLQDAPPAAPEKAEVSVAHSTNGEDKKGEKKTVEKESAREAPEEKPKQAKARSTVDMVSAILFFISLILLGVCTFLSYLGFSGSRYAAEIQASIDTAAATRAQSVNTVKVPELKRGNRGTQLAPEVQAAAPGDRVNPFAK